MASLSDDDRKMLVRLLSDPASDVVEFTESARTGGHRRDEGYQSLLPDAVTPVGAKAAIKESMLQLVKLGGSATRSMDHGDAEMKRDWGVLFEFRVTVFDVPLFIKARLCDDDPDDPTLRVISVKRQD